MCMVVKWNSPLVVLPYSSPSLDIKKKKKKKENKSNKRRNTDFRELACPRNTIWILNRNIESAEAVFQMCFIKKRVLQKFGKICRKTSVPDSLLGWKPAVLWKRDSQAFSYELFKTFKSTFLTEYLQATASWNIIFV